MNDGDGSRSVSDLAHALSRWIDEYPVNAARDHEAAMWGRVSKVCEEAGEVIAALLAATNHNPRKPSFEGTADVERELLDVALTALCAVAHLHGNDGTDVTAMLADHARRVAERAGV